MPKTESELKKIIVHEKRLAQKHQDNVSDAEEKLQLLYELPKRKKLIGKCFKYNNGCSADTRWWLYSQIIGVDQRGQFIVNRFEIRAPLDSDINIKVHDIIGSDYLFEKQITLAEYLEQWNKIIRKISKIREAINASR